VVAILDIAVDREVDGGEEVVCGEGTFIVCVVTENLALSFEFPGALWRSVLEIITNADADL
jgi:hypothetical protein